ncbi:MAG: hypothetical protein IT170_15970 [Bryobacterales bacterium]|nr:hypothetical protein [Bryobacterales bacterium]
MGRNRMDEEAYLAGLPLEDRRTAIEGIEAGMNQKEVQLMCEQARFLRDMRCPDDVCLRPGFALRVMARIESEKPASIWDLFVSPALSKKLAFASLALMAMLAGFVVARSAEQTMMTVETQRVLMEPEHPGNLGTDPVRDRQNMLVTLANYQGVE